MWCSAEFIEVQKVNIYHMIMSDMYEKPRFRQACNSGC